MPRSRIIPAALAIAAAIVAVITGGVLAQQQEAEVRTIALRTGQHVELELVASPDCPASHPTKSGNGGTYRRDAHGRGDRGVYNGLLVSSRNAAVLRASSGWLVGTPLAPETIRYHIVTLCFDSEDRYTAVTEDVDVVITGAALDAHDRYYQHRHSELAARVAQLEAFIRAVCFAHHPDVDDPYPAPWQWCENVPPAPAAAD